MRPSHRYAIPLLFALGCAVTAACGGSSGDPATGAQGGQPSSTATPTTAMPVQLFATDFHPVCQGATVSKATPYDKTAPTGHKVIFLTSTSDNDGMVESGLELPADWRVTFSPTSDAYAAVDLVACAVRGEETFVKDCDGYKKDDQPTGNIAKLYNATYKLSVREATTGTELATTDLTTTEDSCPMIVSFDADSNTVDYYAALPEAPIIEFLKPFVQP